MLKTRNRHLTYCECLRRTRKAKHPHSERAGTAKRLGAENRDVCSQFSLSQSFGFVEVETSAWKIKMKCLTLITLIVLLAALNCEKYSAIIEMEKLAHDEDFILAEFESFVNEMEMEIKYLAR